MSLNKFIGIGRLTADAQLSFTAGKGTAVAKFTVAIDDGYGENKEVSFLPIVVFGKSAEAVANYTKKGSLVMVQGKVKTRSYEKDGVKRYVTEIIADNYNGIQFLDGKSNNNTQAPVTTGNENLGEDITPVDDGDIPF